MFIVLQQHLTLFAIHQLISFIISPKDATDILSTWQLVVRPQNGVQVHYGITTEYKNMCAWFKS